MRKSEEDLIKNERNYRRMRKDRGNDLIGSERLAMILTFRRHTEFKYLNSPSRRMSALGLKAINKHAVGNSELHSSSAGGLVGL